jgi:hypothetical protein
MEHVVFHPGPDGAPAFHRFGSLDEAVRLVEHLRNVEGVEDVSVHLLTPVPLAFRAYYKVEMPSVDALVPEQPVAVEPAPVDLLPVDALPAEPMAAEPMPAEPMAAELVAAEPMPVEASANGKRSLGFFSH